MSRQRWSVSAVLVLAGCATASPAVVETAPARADTFACARGVLVARGYEVREADRSARTLEAEVRRAYPPSGAVREIISASLAQPAESGEELRISIRAWDYRPAEHGLPIRRQSVTEIHPSDEAVTDARQVLDSCGARTRAGGALGR